MMWVETLLLSTLLIAFAVWRLKKRLRYFEELGMPHIKPESLLDVKRLGFFSKKSMGEDFDEVYRELEGHGYGGFYNLYSPVVMLRRPEVVNKLLAAEFQHFNDHGLPADEQTNPFEESLFFLSGAKWKALRRKMTPAFSTGKLRYMFDLIAGCTDHLQRFLDERRGAEVEMKELISGFTTDVIASCAFGIEPATIRNPQSAFREMGKKFFDRSFFLQILEVIRFVIPEWFRKLGVSTQPKDVTEFFMNLTTETIRERMRTGTERKDFVQLLVQLKEKGYVEQDKGDPAEETTEAEQDNLKIEFTDSVLAAQAFIFFIAGFETTASAISFTLYLLAKHEGVRERARKEVREAKAIRGRIDYDAVKSMPYLEACIDETMRLYPPIHILPRKCTKDYRMDDGAVIKKGIDVTIPIYSIHRDPQLHPEPTTFRPERFLGEEKKRILPGSYIPFGHGPRMCIAQRFALLESMLCLSVVLDNFDFVLSSRMSEPLRLKSDFFVTLPAGGLWLKFRRLE